MTESIFFFFLSHMLLYSIKPVVKDILSHSEIFTYPDKHKMNIPNYAYLLHALSLGKHKMCKQTNNMAHISKTANVQCVIRRY